MQEQSDIEIVGECSNAVEGIWRGGGPAPGCAVSHIQMPRISGLDAVGMLYPEHCPYIVFIRV
ncbi:hypothetical protein ACNKHU_13025 [Shigella flexneri]